MTSAAHRSEDDLAKLACAAMVRRPRPRVLLGGLGMGYTLRAALDQLPPAAEVTVVELNPVVVEWCRGPLARAHRRRGRRPARAGRDRRRRRRDRGRAPRRARRDPARSLRRPAPPARRTRADPLYGAPAIDSAWSALRAGGVLAVWAEEPDRVVSAAPARRRLHRRGARGRRPRRPRPRGLRRYSAREEWLGSDRERRRPRASTLRHAAGKEGRHDPAHLHHDDRRLAAGLGLRLAAFARRGAEPDRRRCARAAVRLALDARATGRATPARRRACG